LKGFLSFKTTYLNGTTIGAAQLLLKQSVNNSHFSDTNPCQDIDRGIFGHDQMLKSEDYNWTDTSSITTNAFPITGVGLDSWFTADLTEFVADISNNNNYTQFRLHRRDGIDPNNYVGWYAGDSPGNEPQLIVQYQ
jgi:hypothetical protein